MLWRLQLLRHGKIREYPRALCGLDGFTSSPQHNRHFKISYSGLSKPSPVKEPKKQLQSPQDLGHARPKESNIQPQNVEGFKISYSGLPQRPALKKPRKQKQNPPGPSHTLPQGASPFAQSVEQLWKASEKLGVQDDMPQDSTIITSHESEEKGSRFEPAPPKLETAATPDDSYTTSCPGEANSNSPTSSNPALLKNSLHTTSTISKHKKRTSETPSDKVASTSKRSELVKEDTLQQIIPAPRPWENEGIFGILQEIGEGLEKGSKSNTERDDNPSDSDLWANLPLSPLMHPELLKARSRFRTTKARPNVDKSDFEADVARNPFGK